MADTIYRGSDGEISVDNLVLKDKAGTGECTVKSPSGVAWQAKGVRMEYVAVTAASIILNVSDSGKTLSNDGAAGIVQVTLPPTPGAGIAFSFIRVAAQAFRVNPPNGSQIIYSGGTMADGEYLELASDGAQLSVISDGNGNWIATSEMGTLTEESP